MECPGAQGRALSAGMFFKRSDVSVLLATDRYGFNTMDLPSFGTHSTSLATVVHFIDA